MSERSGADEPCTQQGVSTECVPGKHLHLGQSPVMWWGAEGILGHHLIEWILIAAVRKSELHPITLCSTDFPGWIFRGLRENSE